MATDLDPRAYVRSLLPQGARSPQALAAVEPQLKEHGMSLQRNSAGDIRGRVYLPSQDGDPYSNFMDVMSGSWGASKGGSSGAPVNHAMARPGAGQSDLMSMILDSLQQQQAQPTMQDYLQQTLR